MLENKKKCSKCGEIKSLEEFSKNKSGRDCWCKNCHKLYKMNKKKEICSICGKLKKVDKRINKNPICSVCNAKQNIDICYLCKKNKVVSKRTSLGAICKNCNRPKDICSVCGEFKRIETSNPKLCEKCYKNATKEECVKCHKLKAVNIRTEAGPLCSYCSAKKEICSVCGKLKLVHKKQVCASCSNKNRYKNDENYRMRRQISARIRGYIKNKTNIKYKEIILFLGPCPGKQYHIDHIFPLSAFDLTNKLDLIVAFCPENHQWLPAVENLSKGSKYDKKEFEKFKQLMFEKYKGD
jgi:hypothetical protein